MQFNVTHRGVVFVIFAVFLMSLQDAFFKYLSNEVGLWQIFLVRGFIVIAFLLVFMRFIGGDLSTWKEAFRPWILARSGLFGLMFISFYAAISMLDLAIASAGYYTAPIFITLLSAILLAERIKVWGWCAVIIGFTGVVIILQPSGAGFDFRILIPVFSGFCYALAAIIVRTKCQKEKPAALVASLNFMMMGLGAFGTVILYYLDLSETHVAIQPFLFRDWAMLHVNAGFIVIALAVIMVSSAYLLVRAYQLSAPNIVAPFDYTYLVFSVIWGAILFSQIPDLETFLGMVLIAGAGLLTLKS